MMILPSSVVRLTKCHLTLSPEPWRFAEDHRDAIDRHWERRSKENPSFFNGTVCILGPRDLRDAEFHGTLIATEFKAYLFWREHGTPGRTVNDCFGAALIRSCDGHVLFGRQRAGNINAGLVYPPGGFIDRSDADDTGRVDIAGSISREMAEETGLSAGEVTPVPGFLMASAGPHIALAVLYRVEQTAETLQTAMRAHIAKEARPELDDIVILRSMQDIEPETPEYAKRLLRALFETD